MRFCQFYKLHYISIKLQCILVLVLNCSFTLNLFQLEKNIFNNFSFS